MLKHSLQACRLAWGVPRHRWPDIRRVHPQRRPQRPRRLEDWM